MSHSVTVRSHPGTLKTNTVEAGGYSWTADQPLESGGQALGPAPYDHLLAALGVCTTMTITSYAALHDIPLDHVDITVKHERKTEAPVDGQPEHKWEEFHEEITLFGDLDESQRTRLLRAATQCSVNKTLQGEVRISKELTEAPVAATVS